MQYRQFGKLDWQVSALGFGCMRLPSTDGKSWSPNIDEAEATRMVRHAIDHGLNYIDTAYPYHGGESESFVGRMLQDGYRDKVKLATKLPVWLCNEHADFDRLLNEQLRKLQTDYVDFYLLHALNKDSWAKVRDMGVLDWAEGAIADGRIKHLGFSFHDTEDVFMEIVDAYDWTFCQIQYNYMDIENQAGMAGLKHAASKGLAVVIMEPLLGGKLAMTPPDPVQALWDTAETRRKPADWALQWIWNQPEVSLILSGMSTMEQVEENLVSGANSGVEVLNAEEIALIEQVRATYETLSPIPCTKCQYCMPCPTGLNIPELFERFNNAFMYDRMDIEREGYGKMPVEKLAEACIACQECEEACPQHIPISAWMPIVHDVLGEGTSYDPSMSPA